MLSLNAAGFLDKPSVTLSGAERQIRPNKSEQSKRIANAFTQCGRILGQAKRHPIGCRAANPPEQMQIRPNKSKSTRMAMLT